MQRSFLLSLAASIVPAFASATVIERDWIFPGDGLITYDPATGLEWLDVSQTGLADFSGSLLEDRYSSVVAETGSGGRFDGFRVATASEAQSLVEAAGMVFGSTNFNENQAGASLLMSLVGETLLVPDRFQRLSGVLSEVLDNQSGQSVRLILRVSRDPAAGPSGVSQALLGPGYRVNSDPYPNPNADLAVLLVRVPEPSGFVLSVLVGTIVLPRRR